MASMKPGDAARLAHYSGLGVIGLHLAYAAATIGGFLTLESPRHPIADPWFAMMEVLIIALGPPVLVFLVALSEVEAARRSWILAAAILTGIAFALSASLHAVLLGIGRSHTLVAKEGMLAFTWPSVAYAVDILAWDWFFACALLCAGMGLKDAPAMRYASQTFLLAGLIALAGLLGPALSSMAVRNLGIVGYAGLFPVAVGLVLRALAARDTTQPTYPDG
jgi:hypothetical protein